jgi:hypothetical protein
MGKLILLSVIIGNIAVPVLSARDPNAVRGFKKAIVFTFIFNVFYLLAVRYVYPRLL